MTATTDDILALEERCWAAQIGKDEAELMTLLSDELRCTHSTGSLDTKASYMASILEARCRQFELNVAYTAVWVERNGSWQLLTGQSTLLGA